MFFLSLGEKNIFGNQKVCVRQEYTLFLLQKAFFLNEVIKVNRFTYFIYHNCRGGPQQVSPTFKKFMILFLLVAVVMFPKGSFFYMGRHILRGTAVDPQVISCLDPLPQSVLKIRWC
ncbi:unnamed protein product [Phytomonas sp. EM1]|nr:unnamed protein product [Phytomonas sp. EM1]|eukprot:CCW62869.1 unnamed protein product [Phytomonas sp. isolate EM1]